MFANLRYVKLPILKQGSFRSCTLVLMVFCLEMQWEYCEFVVVEKNEKGWKKLRINFFILFSERGKEYYFIHMNRRGVETQILESQALFQKGEDKKRILVRLYQCVKIWKDLMSWDWDLFVLLLYSSLFHLYNLKVRKNPLM